MNDPKNAKKGTVRGYEYGWIPDVASAIELEACREIDDLLDALEALSPKGERLKAIRDARKAKA